MSATIDAASFVEYFTGSSLWAGESSPVEESEASAAHKKPKLEGGFTAEALPAAELVAPPVLAVGSRTHPVACFHLESLQEALADIGPPSVNIDEGSAPNGATKLHPSIYSLLEFVLVRHVQGQLLPRLPGVPEGVKPEGGVLVFLPGFSEISECRKALQRGQLGKPDSAVELMPLHSLQEDDLQRSALQRPPAGFRKVILATNIAESSITVPDVTLVIDLGLEKLPYYDAKTNTDSLLLRRCARASAMQRAGRAGRVAPGVCLRLYPAHFMQDEALMAAFTPAEMERTSLLNLILKVKLIDPIAPPAALLHEALQPPSATRVNAAVDALCAIGALTNVPEKPSEPADEGTDFSSLLFRHAAPGSLGGKLHEDPARLTPLGLLVAPLPVSAPLGRLMVLAEALNCGRQGAIIAALLTLPDPFLQPYSTRNRAKGGANGLYEGPEAAAKAAAEAAAEAAEDVEFFRPRLAHFMKRGCSDPLASLALFEQWQSVLSNQGQPEAAQYAHSQHASYKRLSEVEFLSRDLANKLKQQRIDHGLLLPAAASKESAGPSMLVLQSLLCSAFLPNVAAGSAQCPQSVLEELTRHKLDPRKAVHFMVAPGPQGGAHLSQAHLSAAFKPCGELQQALISKERVPRNGQMVLQTSACLSFSQPSGAMLAIRMAGLKSSLAVPLVPEGGQKPLGTAWLQQPQYACRLRFERQAPSEQMLIAPQESAGASLALPLGEDVLPVDMNWGSSSAVLSELEFSSEQRFLLASAWSSAAGGLKLIAQSPSLLPNKPKGAAQMLIIIFSRALRLVSSPWGGAFAAQLADGDRGLAFALPWLLSAAEVEEINALRAGLSACVGARPRQEGESATALQLRLMRLLVAERDEISPELFSMAVDLCMCELPFVQCEWAQALLPPLELPPPIVPGAPGTDGAADAAAEAAQASDAIVSSEEAMTIGVGASEGGEGEGDDWELQDPDALF